MIRFVTGTDTGVGKTVCSAVLALRARDAGMRVRYLKPIQTGAAPDQPADADFVGRFAHVDTFEFVRLDEPLAPAVAAARAGLPIDLDDLVARAQSLAEGCDILLVEGAGGLLVPLTMHATMADLARLLAADLILVARPGLGTLNHVTLTLEAAARRKLAVSSLVLSGWPDEPDVVQSTNLELLRERGLLVETIPLIAEIDVDRGIVPAHRVGV